MPSSDLTPENVGAIFLDSLASDDEAPEVIIVVEGLSEAVRFQAERLYSHVLDAELMLSHASCHFYGNRGGGHTCSDLALRRDGSRWGGDDDAERLLVLGMGMSLIGYCRRERTDWALFPKGMPYIQIKSRLFKLWANFHSGTGATLTVHFEPESYPPPADITETSWYMPKGMKVGVMGERAKHVAEAFYSDIVVRGFFDKQLPSWILDQDTLLKVY